MDEDEKEEEFYMIESLESEISVVMELDHPNIIKFHQFLYDNQYLNLVMEYVDGPTLSKFFEQRINDKEAMSELEVQVIIR